MSFLLDTNVISERMRQHPNENVALWFEITPSSMQYISVITLGEIRKGIEKLDGGARKTALSVWLERDLPEWFAGRLLPIDKEVAERWGYLVATVKRSLPSIDGLIAATALVHNLTVVTRNVQDFTIPGLEVINPWE